MNEDIDPYFISPKENKYKMKISVEDVNISKNRHHPNLNLGE